MKNFTRYEKNKDLHVSAWIFSEQEHQEGNKNIEVADTNIKQTVYAFKCNNCVIKVKNKLNSITLGKGQRVFWFFFW